MNDRAQWGTLGHTKKMPDFLIPKSPLVSGLLAFVSLGSTWLACRMMRYTDGDDDE